MIVKISLVIRFYCLNFILNVYTKGIITSHILKTLGKVIFLFIFQYIYSLVLFANFILQFMHNITFYNIHHSFIILQWN